MGEKKEVSYLVGDKIQRLLNGSNEAHTKAVLAQMRRGIGHAPGEIPELWGMMLENIPEKMMSKDGVPTYAEWAIYTALTLFALHQQGHEQCNPMFVKGQSLGKAMRSLVPPEDGEVLKRVRRRFNVIATSSDMPELVHHLRSAVQLLRDAGIGLDYAELAGELYLYQIPGGAAEVRLLWGEKFYQISENDLQRKEDE